MKTQIFTVVLSLLVGSSLLAKTNLGNEKGFYLVPNKFVKAANATKKQKLKILEKRDKVSLLKMSLDDVEKLSEIIHKETGACGGFEDVTEEVLSAKKRGQTKSFMSSVKNSLLAERTKFTSKFKKRPIRFLAADKFLVNKINISRYETDLTRLVQFPDRSARTDNGQRAAQWLKDEVTDYAKANNRTDVTTRFIETGRRYKQKSVVAVIKGKNPSKEGGVLLGGHMDTFKRNKPGADDDGSGTIAVMEVYKALIDSKIKFNENIYFAFYAAEELGLIGSKQVVKQFVKEKIKLQGVMQFDMTGFRSKKETKSMYFIDDNVNVNLTQFSRDLAVKVLDITVQNIGKTSCGYACSDHASWHKSGYAAVFPFESSFANHNRALHTSRDTISLLDMEHSIQFAKLGIAFASEIAKPIKPNSNRLR